MPMGVGIWFNPKTDEVFNFGSFDTHDRWLKKPDNAEKLGLRQETIKLLPTLTDADDIRYAAINDGMVRVRDYQNRISVQFKARRGIKDVLILTAKMLERIFHPNDYISIHNLATGEAVELSLADMLNRLREDTPIMFREQTEAIEGDVLYDPVAQNLMISKLQEMKRKMASENCINNIAEVIIEDIKRSNI